MKHGKPGLAHTTGERGGGCGPRVARNAALPRRAQRHAPTGIRPALLQSVCTASASHACSWQTSARVRLRACRDDVDPAPAMGGAARADLSSISAPGAKGRNGRRQRERYEYGGAGVVSPSCHRHARSNTGRNSGDQPATGTVRRWAT